MRFNNPILTSALALMCGMVSIQTGATLAKGLFPAIGPGGTTAMRLAFAAIILAVVWRPFRQRLNRAQAISVAIYGLSLGIMNLFFYMALVRLPLGIAVALEFTGPLLLATFSSRRVLDFTWVAIAATGLVLLLPGIDPNAHIDATGVCYALIAGTCWALYIIFGQRSSTLLHGGSAAALGMIVGAVCIAPVGAAQAGSALLRPDLIPLGLLVAVLSSAFPYSMEMIALAKLPAKTFSVMMSLEPAIGALSGRILLGEHLTHLQWAAIGCVVVASGGAAFTSRSGATPVPDIQSAANELQA